MGDAELAPDPVGGAMVTAMVGTLFTDGNVSRDVSSPRIFCGETDVVEWPH